MKGVFVGNVATAFLASALVGFPVAAQERSQEDRIRALEQRLAASLRQIDKLSARVAELEHAPSTTPTQAAKRPPEPIVPDAGVNGLAELKGDVDQIAQGLSRRQETAGLALHGFADVGLGWSSAQDPSRQQGFSVGSLDLYLTPQFGDRVKALAELVFEYEESGHGKFDLERLQLGYAFGDALTLWAGRFHTPFGLWNSLFHHGAYLQTSISRPRLVEFEDRGGAIPAHSVGLWASGKTRLGAGKLSYEAYVANGSRIEGGRIESNGFTDDNGNKMIGGSLGYEFAGPWSGLSAGVHGFGFDANALASTGQFLGRSKVRMSGVYAGYLDNGWEAIGEYYHFNNSDAADGLKRSSNAWFLQVGREFGPWTPFARLEDARFNEADPYFMRQQFAQPYRRVVAGLKYSLAPDSSLKVEFADTRESPASLFDQNGIPVPMAAKHYRRAAVQYSIAF